MQLDYPHPGIHRMLSAGDAIKQYGEAYQADQVRPMLTYWWYWYETQREDGRYVRECDPNYLGFTEWKSIRSIPDVDQWSQLS